MFSSQIKKIDFTGKSGLSVCEKVLNTLESNEKNGTKTLTAVQYYNTAKTNPPGLKN